MDNSRRNMHDGGTLLVQVSNIDKPMTDDRQVYVLVTVFLLLLSL